MSDSNSDPFKGVIGNIFEGAESVSERNDAITEAMIKIKTLRDESLSIANAGGITVMVQRRRQARAYAYNECMQILKDMRR